MVVQETRKNFPKGFCRARGACQTPRAAQQSPGPLRESETRGGAAAGPRMMDQLWESGVKRDGAHAKPLTLMSPQLRQWVPWGRQERWGGGAGRERPQGRVLPRLASGHAPQGSHWPSLGLAFQRRQLW